MGASLCYYLGGLLRLRSSSGSAQQRPANVLFEIFFESFFLPYKIVVALASMFHGSCHYCVLSYSERVPLRCFIPMAHFLVVSFAGSGLGGASSIRTISIQFATLPINSFPQNPFTEFVVWVLPSSTAADARFSRPPFYGKGHYSIA